MICDGQIWDSFFWRTETQKKVHLIFGAPVKPIVARSSVVLRCRRCRVAAAARRRRRCFRRHRHSPLPSPLLVDCCLCLPLSLSLSPPLSSSPPAVVVETPAFSHAQMRAHTHDVQTPLPLTPTTKTVVGVPPSVKQKVTWKDALFPRVVPTRVQCIPQ